VASAAPQLASNARAAPWIWGARVDLAVFGGSALLALALVALERAIAPTGALPPWAWIAFVLAIDVAHVHATLFRTYLDRDELGRRPLTYALVPLACWLFGAGLHSRSPLVFWRALAYLAVFHFIRQQAGWAAIYRARAGERDRTDRILDDALIYLATGYPLVYWHAHLPRAYHWLIDGDFLPLPFLERALAPLGALYAATLLAYIARAVALAARTGTVNVGKHLVVATTAATWYIGVVATNTDFAFTVSNVVVHGVPYMALLWAYARERAGEAPRSPIASVVRGGVVAFLAILLVLAFGEEMLWDRLVWHDRPELFGGADDALLSPAALSLIVPLLAVPQATHYVLDALLWRRGATGPAQARALGFARP